MRTPKKRHTVVAALALALSVLPATAALSLEQSALQCQPIPRPTPSAEIDTNNDGNPEVRVPSVSNISVCAEGDVFVYTDVARVEPCGFTPMTCSRILVDLETEAGLGSNLRVCRAVDGAYSCSTVDQPEWSIGTPSVNTLCIGIDLNGGFPCGGGTSVIAFQ